MFKYFPQTPDDVAAMLKVIGARSIDDLFSDISPTIKWKDEYHVPSAMSEMEIRRHFAELANENRTLICFRGAGAYDHYLPSLVKPLISRQEFLTSYTPYQPEISQGTLQYIFEFQSMITQLTGMDVSNASMYDGATATAEALFMAQAASRFNTVIVSDLMNPEIIDVLKTYAHYRGLKLKFVDSKEGKIDRHHLQSLLNEEPASFVGQYPNYFGVIEDFTDISAIIHAQKGLVIINANPSNLSILKTPRDMGADMACGDGQSLGIPLSFGGPYVGYLTTTMPLVRKMPGRIAGMTKDVDGKRAFVLTLQAREQHIRRDKANSNICSNQSLMALFTTIYMATLGKQGLIDVNERGVKAAHYLADNLIKTGHFNFAFEAPFADEFALKSDLNLARLNRHLEKRGFLGGLPVKLPSGEDAWLLSVTEKRSLEDLQTFLHEIEVFAQ